MGEGGDGEEGLVLRWGMRNLSDALFVILATALFSGFLAAGACVPNPTQQECHRQTDCLGCVTAFCSWCGPRPGVAGEKGRACYAPALKPEACDAPPHYAFCYGGATDPIDNRMYLRRQDGGASDARSRPTPRP